MRYGNYVSYNRVNTQKEILFSEKVCSYIEKTNKNLYIIDIQIDIRLNKVIASKHNGITKIITGLW